MRYISSAMHCGREIFLGFLHYPSASLRLLANLGATIRGFAWASAFPPPRPKDRSGSVPAFSDGSGLNPLREFFDSRITGRGIWKWLHYFDIYHRHLGRFVGTDAHVAEVGIYSGGSLQMWRHYFGSRCHIYGIDIEPACQCYEDEGATVLIGDQSDRSFWAWFKAAVPRLDVLIDDGGHRPEQQIITLEEVLPHLRPGGVYICEDIHGVFNPFSAYLSGFLAHLDEMRQLSAGSENPKHPTSSLQAGVRAVHRYPFVTVIEKHDSPAEALEAPKHGSEWQPFL